MEQWIKNQENLIKLVLFEEVVGEQLKSQAAEDGLEKGKRGTKATPAQIVGYKRRTESIFLDMIKEEWLRNQHQNKQLPVQYTIEKRNMRKRKRGPRSIKAILKRHDFKR